MNKMFVEKWNGIRKRLNEIKSWHEFQHWICLNCRIKLAWIFQYSFKNIENQWQNLAKNILQWIFQTKFADFHRKSTRIDWHLMGTFGSPNIRLNEQLKNFHSRCTLASYHDSQFSLAKIRTSFQISKEFNWKNHQQIPSHWIMNSIEWIFWIVKPNIVELFIRVEILDLNLCIGSFNIFAIDVFYLYIYKYFFYRAIWQSFEIPFTKVKFTINQPVCECTLYDVRAQS